MNHSKIKKAIRATLFIGVFDLTLFRKERDRGRGSVGQEMTFKKSYSFIIQFLTFYRVKFKSQGIRSKKHVTENQNGLMQSGAVKQYTL